MSKRTIRIPGEGGGGVGVASTGLGAAFVSEEGILDRAVATTSCEPHSPGLVYRISSNETHYSYNY